MISIRRTRTSNPVTSHADRPVRRRFRAVALAVVALSTFAGATTFGATGSAQAAGAGYYWYTKNLDADRWADAKVYWDGARWRFDKPVVLDLDNNGRLDTTVFDGDGNGRYDVATFDFDGNGSIESAIDLQTSFFCTDNYSSSRYTRWEGFGRYWGHCSYLQSTITVHVGWLSDLLSGLAGLTGVAV